MDTIVSRLAVRFRRASAATAGNKAIAATLLLVLAVALLTVASTAYFLKGQYDRLGGTYFLIDDTWIHLRFAQNLAEGHGFCFNPGHPIAASTAPLWTCLLALSYRLTGELGLFAYFWGIVFFAMTCLLVYGLVGWITDSLPLAAAAAILAACCPWLTWSALSGMEITFSAAFVLLTLLLHLRYLDSDGWQGLLGVVAAAMTTLTRPETYVLLLAVVVHKVARSLLPLRVNLRRTLCAWLPMAAVLVALIVLPYGLFSIATAGSFFPNTYTAKVGDLGVIGAIKAGSVEAIEQALVTNPRLYLDDLVEAVEEISPILIAVLPFALFGLLRKDAAVLPLLVVLFPLLVGMVVPTKRISWPWYRHMLNLIPVFVVVSLAGSHQLLKAALSRTGKWAAPLRAIVLAVLAIALALDFVAQQPDVRESFIARGSAMKTEHVSVAQWINEQLPPQAVIAASDIGVVGFCTQRFIVDTEGLVTPDALGPERSDSPAKDRQVYEYLSQVKPDYLLKFRWVYPTFSEEEFPPIYASGNLKLHRTPWTRD